jgi:hypothetical protein
MRHASCGTLLVAAGQNSSAMKIAVVFLHTKCIAIIGRLKIFVEAANSLIFAKYNGILFRIPFIVRKLCKQQCDIAT